MEQSKINEVYRAAGTRSKEENEATEWFTSVPNLLKCITCKAWELRKETPMFIVEGGVDPQIPKRIVVMKRRDWELIWDQNRNIGAFLRDPDFDNEKMFVVAFTARHPGTEKWPTLRPQIHFPRPLVEMDAWVERQLRTIPEYLAGLIEVREPKRDARSHPRKQKPNEPCTCGSGKKFKKCCHKLYL